MHTQPFRMATQGRPVGPQAFRVLAQAIRVTTQAFRMALDGFHMHRRASPIDHHGFQVVQCWQSASRGIRTIVNQATQISPQPDSVRRVISRLRHGAVFVVVNEIDAVQIRNGDGVTIARGVRNIALPESVTV